MAEYLVIYEEYISKVPYTKGVCWLIGKLVMHNLGMRPICSYRLRYLFAWHSHKIKFVFRFQSMALTTASWENLIHTHYHTAVGGTPAFLLLYMLNAHAWTSTISTFRSRKFPNSVKNSFHSTNCCFSASYTAHVRTCLLVQLLWSLRCSYNTTFILVASRAIIIMRTYPY